MTGNSSELLAVVPTVISGVAAIVGGYVALVVARLETKIEKGRADDREQMRVWINGAFMRAPEVRAELRGIGERIEDAEIKLEALHTYTHEQMHEVRADLTSIKKFGCEQREGHIA